MERNNLVKKGSILGIIGNIFLFIIKIIIGIMSKSQAMIADSLNSAGDIFASFMTWLGNRISSVPNDDDHNFGHGKAEYIFSMLISISMMVISIKLLYDSLISIIYGNRLIFSWRLVIICFVTIITKLILYLCTKNIYKKTNSLLIKSNMIDHRNDMIITLFTTIAIILTTINIYFFDGIVGLGISVWIFITGVKIYKESYDVLMDTSIDNKTKDVILRIIKSYDEIRRIGEFYSIPIGYKYVVVITIFVNGNLKTKNSHEITEEIEKEVKKKVCKIEQLIIHVEPYEN